MLSSYKKRFVIMTMSLVGAILTIVFVVMGIYIGMEKYRLLENTMNQVVRPFDMQKLNDWIGQDNDDRIGQGDKMFEGGNRNDIQTGNYQFAIYMYNVYDKSYSVVSSSDFIKQSELSNIIESVVKSDKSFDMLKNEGVIFLKEKSIDNSSYRIVLTASSQYFGNFFRDIGFIFTIFVFLILSFLLLSKKLSSVAAKPMENAMELEKQFVTDVSHDLKTPITVILANNSILKSSPDSTISEQMQWINSTETASRNMLEMINEMLTFSSLEAENQNIVFERINASSAAEKCVLQFESVAYDRNIEFNSDIDKDIFIKSTNEFTERIFNSIIENAFKYEPNKGRIFVSMKTEKKKAIFKVRNYNSYISEEDLQHIFEKFYRADKTRNEQKGHGLGLPIVMQITKLIGGKISVSSTKEQGTEFSVVFDIAEK